MKKKKLEELSKMLEEELDRLTYYNNDSYKFEELQKVVQKVLKEIEQERERNYDKKS